MNQIAQNHLEQLKKYRASAGTHLVTPRSDSVVYGILANLAEQPIVTSEMVVQQHGVSSTTANDNLNQLVEAGVLNRVKIRGKIIGYSADLYLKAIDLGER